MSIHTVSTTISLPWTLEWATVLRITLSLGILTLLWPRERMRPHSEATVGGPYLLASTSLMVSYWVVAGIVLVALHIFNVATILAIAALPRIIDKPQIQSRYRLRWNVKFLVTILETIEHPEVILRSLKAHGTGLLTLCRVFRQLGHFPSFMTFVAFSGALAVSLWLRLDTVFRHAAPFYQNAFRNIAWTNALTHSHWMVGGHPIPLGSFILIAEISRVGFVNPLMLEKLAASLVFIGTASGLAAVTWSITRSMAASLAVITAIGVFPQWLPMPLARELAIGPTALGMMGAIPAFWLMYHVMRTGYRIYGIASLALVFTAGVTNFDAGVLTATAAFVGWMAAWATHHIQVRRGLGWLLTLVMAWLTSSIPMLFQRLVSHQWPVTTTMFPLPSSALHTPQLSLFEIALFAGVLIWVAIRIWIEDYGASVGILLLLVLAVGLQESSIIVPWHFHLTGTRQLLTVVESIAIGGIVCLLFQDLITLSKVFAISLVSLAAAALGVFIPVQPFTTYTTRSDSYVFAYEMVERTNRPYSWLIVSNGGVSLAAGAGYRMDPLQWTSHVRPERSPLMYRGSNRTYRRIAQHHIFLFVERHIHTSPVPNNEFTVLREQIRNRDLELWLAHWKAAHPQRGTLAVFFKSPQLTVYRLGEGAKP